VGAAIVVLLMGLTMAAFNEAEYKQQKASELGVQAQIVSASVAPALMFYNPANAQDYLNALAANPAIAAAAVYDSGGARVAVFNRAGATAPPASAALSAPHFDAQSAIVVAPVMRNGERLGAVYMRTDAESPLRRFSRYAGVGVLILLAALVLTVFGLAQGALSQANAELRRRAQQLQQEIEQREKAEEALLQSRKLEALGQLTGGVAHDFNNLLTVVLSGLRLMERNADPVRRASTMEAMRQAVERGAGLTKQLLAFSRRQTLKLEPVDIAHRLQNMRELLERSLRADILIEISAAPDLWAAMTDPAQFELALLNLAVNARDAMPKGGVITINAENRSVGGADYVEVSVRDTGLGIPPDLLSRVFEPYFTTKQAGQGTGLGLSQVYGIAVQSGGSAAIESVINEGTCVRLLLPRSLEAPAAPPQITPSPPKAHGASGKSILVVEDDNGVAAMVSEMLQQIGYIPTRVADAAAALNAVEKSCDYDLVFSDIVMPGEMNGVELAQHIRERYPHTPIVLTSGYSGSANMDVDFPLLRKPYALEELEEVMARALRSER
jgi:signal transduction histidine kinase